MLVHESSDVIAQIFPPEVVGAIGVTEISRVEDVHISLVDDFVGWVGEEIKPAFGLIEGFREED